MVKLADSRVKWIIRRKEEGSLANHKIARVQDTTPGAAILDRKGGGSLGMAHAMTRIFLDRATMAF